MNIRVLTHPVTATLQLVSYIYDAHNLGDRDKGHPVRAQAIVDYLRLAERVGALG